MERRAPASRARAAGDGGFTLVELMVVVLIIAILIAIAIPTFAGARTKAQDRAAQSDLRTALVNAKTLYTDGQDYTLVNASALTAVEPSIVFVPTTSASPDPKTVSVNPSSTNVIVLAAWSKSGTCFSIRDSVAPGGGTTYARVGTSQPGCTGTAAASATYSGW